MGTTYPVTLTQNMTAHQASAPQVTYNPVMTQKMLARIFTDLKHTPNSGSNVFMTYLVDGLAAPVDKWGPLSTATALAQNITAAMSSTTQWKWGRTLAQALKVHLTAAEQMTYSVTDAEVIHLASAMIRTFPAVLSQNLTAHMATKVALGLTVLQRLKLLDASSPQVTYNLGLLQAIVMNSALGQFFGAALSETVDISSTLARKYVTSPVMAQAITASDTLSNTLVLQFSDTRLT